MTYTFWSRGELLGESELDYVRVFPKLRTGDLQVTPLGLRVFERLTQYRADAYCAVKRLNRQNPEDPSDLSTLNADLAAQFDQYAAVGLEVRAPNGSVIPTEDIYVSDTDYLVSISGDADADDEGEPDAALQESIEHDLRVLEEHWARMEAEHPPWLPKPPEREPARFQVFVKLTSEWSIP